MVEPRAYGFEMKLWVVGHQSLELGMRAPWDVKGLEPKGTP